MSKRTLTTMICYEQGEVRWRFDLSKRKLLVGSFEHADVHLNDPHISTYHAMMTVENGIISVIDLQSDNGVWVNGQRVERASLGDGDRLRFGPVEFLMEEISSETDRIEDVDQDVIKLEEEDIGSLLPGLPPKEGLVVIDDEYCDITFDESSFQAVSLSQILATAVDVDSFVDVSEAEVEDEDIVVPIDDRSIEVMVLSNGVILGTEYLRMRHKQYFLGGRNTKDAVLFPILEPNQKIPFAKQIGTGIEFLDITGFEKTQDDEATSWTYRTLQVIAREVETPPHLKIASLIGRDTAFLKDSGKIFGTVMGLMLLLLLVDTSIKPPEEKQIAVIYRKAIKSEDVTKTKTADTPNKVDKDDGVKQKEYEKKEVQTAKAAAQQPQPKQQPASAPAAAAPAPSQQKVAEKPKMKAYEFKMNSAMSSFMNSKSPTVDANSASRSLASTSNVKSANTNSKNLLKAQSSGAVGSLGESMNGAFNRDSGAKGLAAKGGIDTTYAAPKTVVMGSMDPELLRKILAEYLPQFRHCYQQELQKQEDVEGVLDMNFRIGKDGKVSKINIKAKDSRFSGGGVDCMASVLRLIDFPKPKGGGIVDVRQPLNFFSERAKI